MSVLMCIFPVTNRLPCVSVCVNVVVWFYSCTEIPQLGYDPYSTWNSVIRTLCFQGFLLLIFTILEFFVHVQIICKIVRNFFQMWELLNYIHHVSFYTHVALIKVISYYYTRYWLISYLNIFFKLINLVFY